MQLELCDVAPANWKRLPIAAVCQRFTSGGTPSRKMPHYFSGGTIPWVKTQELTDCVLTETNEYITEDAVRNSSAKLLPANTVLMAMYGATVGQLGVLARPMTCNQACAAMVANPSKCDYRFLYYQLLAAREQIKSLSTGAAQQNLSGAQIKQFVLPFPALTEQSEIAEVLWKIDRRIDLLRQTNATLESIAQALFKSWFIDFDPVRAKQAGREPEGMDAATAALFPAEFEESALGLIPKGWDVTSVAELCARITNGGTPSRSKPEYWTGGNIPWFKTGELFDGHLLQASEHITAEAISRTSAKVLPRHAVLMAIYAAPTVGRLGILTREAAFNQACTGMLAKPEVGPWFLFQTLLHGRDWFNSRANGAAQQNISKAIVESYQCIRPDAAVLHAFNDIAGCLYTSAENNSLQAEVLTNLRDTLLPRLISGKLRLPEAREQFDEATA